MRERISNICRSFLLAAGLVLLSAEAGRADEDRYRPSQSFPYACAINSSTQKGAPMLISAGNGSLKPFGAALRKARLQTLQARIQKIRNAPRRIRIRKAEKLAQHREHVRLLRELPKICRQITSQSCTNGTQEFFEDGLDCGGFCANDCAPSGSPTPSPTPTIAPTLPPNNNECFDDIDNNLDGKTDFDDDGCFQVNAQESSADYGFTRFHPSSDSRIVFVSSSEGDDSNSGLSPDSPKRTMVAAYDLIRDGMPDWLLLKRGDTFDYADWRMRLGRSASADPDYDFSWTKSGRSTAEPMLIGSYGFSTARPLIKQADRHGFRIWNEQFLVLTGIEFYANYCDPNSPEFQLIHCSNSIVLQYANKDIVLENNKVSYSGGGMQIQSIDAGIFDRIQVRRNIIHNSYSGATHSQGLYSFGGGELLIKENVFYHNGWNEDYRMNLRPAAFNQTSWRAVANGRIDVQIDGDWYQLSSLNFSSVSSYGDVAAVLENALQAQLPSPATIELSARGNYLILRSNLASNEDYSLRRYTGGTAGTDIDGPTFLDVKSGNPKTPAATIFNRHMYISHNYSNTTVDGNVTAVGASGAVQVRMGGVVKDNLVLEEPVGISAGHAENPIGIPYTATLTRNVVLGSSNIGSQPRGFGLGWAAGQNSTVSDNIVAHNQRGTGNIEGLFAGTDAVGDANNPNINSVVTNNIVYKWGGAALSSRIENFQNVQIFGNSFLQPLSGIAVAFSNPNALIAGRIIFGGNTYQVGPSVTQPARIGATGYSFAQWETASGEEVNQSVPAFKDPERNISSYLNSLPSHPNGGMQEFMQLAIQQDRFHWAPSLSAYAVNAYIRDGFTAE